MLYKKTGFSLTALLLCMLAVGQNIVRFQDTLYWKGDISIVSHGLYHGCGLSSDGSFFLGDSANLVKVSLPSGKKEILVRATNPEQYAWASVVSPNSKQIAYSWFNGDFFDLMVIDNEDNVGERPVPKLLLQGEKGKTATPYDWSRDGKWILASLVDTNWMAGIALISVNDGTVRVLKDVGKQLFDKISFSPDGKYIVYNYYGNGSSELRIMNDDGSGDRRLLNDSSYSVAPYWSPDGTQIVYLRKNNRSFDLCFVPVSNGELTASSVKAKDSIDFFSPLGFLKDGSFLYGISSPMELNVYEAELDSTTQRLKSPPKLISSRFPGSNSNAIISPDGKHLAYTSGRGGSGRIVVIRQIDNGAERDLAEESGTLIQWFPDNKSILLYRTNENGINYLLRINSDDGITDTLLTLTSDYGNFIDKHDPILSAKGDHIYYVLGKRDSNTSKIMDVDLHSKEEKQIATVNSSDITSFSCSPDGKALSMIVLYQQQKGRPCAIQIIDLTSGGKRELFKEPWGDATKFFGLGWRQDADYIYYVRSDTATRGSLLWRIPSAGGEPQKTGLAMIDLRMPQPHPDGKHIFFEGGRGWFNQTYEIRSIKIIVPPVSRSGRK